MTAPSAAPYSLLYLSLNRKAILFPHPVKLFLENPELREAYRLEGADSWSFKDKRDATPLQAADALAFEAAKEMENCFGAVHRPIRKSAQDLIRPDVDETRWWPRQAIRDARNLAQAEAKREIKKIKRVRREVRGR